MTSSSIDSSLRQSRSARLLRPLIVLLVASFTAGAIALGASSAVAGSKVVVTMTDNPARFVPEKATIKVGDTVEWQNTGKVLHTVTNNPTNAINKADTSSPAGTKPFDSGFMAPGAKYSFTFTVPGTYKYICLPHQKDAMIGTIIVSK
jgi:plastocyanin